MPTLDKMEKQISLDKVNEDNAKSPLYTVTDEENELEFKYVSIASKCGKC